MEEKGFLIGRLQETQRVFAKYLYKQVKLVGAGQDGSREWITVVATICADGTSLSPTLIYKAVSGNLRHLARRLRAFTAELLLHIIAERMDERRARLQLVYRPVREGNGCQSEEVVAAAVCRRSRLTRQHEVPQLVRATQDLGCRLSTSLHTQVAASGRERVRSSSSSLQPRAGQPYPTIRRPYNNEQARFLRDLLASV
jgi:hypothetical protein